MNLDTSINSASSSVGTPPHFTDSGKAGICRPAKVEKVKTGHSLGVNLPNLGVSNA
jgi:hypothetical protein